MQQETIRLPTNLVKECEIIAARTGHRKTEVMRKAFIRGLADMKQLQERGINCMDDIAQEMPLAMQKYLFKHIGLIKMVEALLEKIIPEHARFENAQEFNGIIAKEFAKDFLNKDN